MLTHMLTVINTRRPQPAKTGQQVKAEVQADSEAAAAKLISDQGLVPIDIKLTGCWRPMCSAS